MKRRRLKTIPLWKCRLINAYLILTIILTIAYIFLCFDLLEAARGESFVQDGLNCTIHMNTKYCCGPNSINILSTNLSTSKQVNWTYFPDCHKIQVHLESGFSRIRHGDE